VSAIASSIKSPFIVTGTEVAYLPTNPLRLPPSAEDGAETEAEPEASSEGDIISEELADKVFALVEGLEDTGDVIRVWTNVAGV
jgi:hypothetical protein